MCNLDKTVVGKHLIGDNKKLGRLKFGMAYDLMKPKKKSFIDKDPKIQAEMRLDKQSKKNNGGGY